MQMSLVETARHKEETKEKIDKDIIKFKQVYRRRSGSRKRYEPVSYYSKMVSRLEIHGMEKQGGDIQNAETLPSESSPLPDKDTLVYILDVLQRSDKENIFGQPLDNSVALCYSNTTDEATDFGMIRAKLNEQKYQTLEQFEREVMLVAHMATKYYAERNPFFRKVRGIDELAKRLFYKMKNTCLLEKKQPGKKPRAFTGSSSHSVPRKKNRSSNTPLHQGNEDIASGEFCDRRLTYRPWTDLLGEDEKTASLFDTSPKQFDMVDGGLRYRQSLERFVKDLGPTAKAVAEKKLEELNLVAARDEKLTVRNCDRVDTVSTGNAYISALTGASSNQNLLPQQIVHPSVIVRPSRFSTMPLSSGSGHGFLGGHHSASYLLQQFTNPAALGQGFHQPINYSHIQMENQLRLAALQRQQVARAQQPLPLLSMFAPGTSHAGPSSSTHSLQTASIFAWNKDQRALEGTPVPNLELELRTKPLRPDEAH